MDESKIKELHQIWNKFKISPTEERDLWLNAFITKFLNYYGDIDDNNEHIFQPRDGLNSACNVIGHQFVYDISKTCYKVYSSSFELEEEDEILSSRLIRNYLLEGRGWKLLWILKILGIQNSVNINQLVDLLIPNIPLVLETSYSPSYLPDNLAQKFPRFHCSLSSIELQKLIADSKKSACFCCKNKRKHFSTKQSKIRLRQKLAKENVCTDSNSDTETVPSPIPHLIPISQQQDILRINCPDNVSFQKNCALNIDELDNESISLDQFQSDCEMFSNYKLSVTDFIALVMELLDNMAEVEKHFVSISSSSVSLLKFSLINLNHIKSGKHVFYNWSSVDVKKFRNSLLKLLFHTIPVLKTLPGVVSEDHINDIIQMLLTTSLIIIEKDRKHISELDLQFMYDAIQGVLILINYTTLLYHDNCAKIIIIIRSFLVYEGSQVFCHIISHFEQHSLTSYISEILSSMKTVTLNLKSLRARSMFHEANEGNEACVKDSCSRFHHHHNVLGSTVSYNISRTEPMCCIAAMSYLLFNIFHKLSNKSALKLTIKTIQETGICCCVDHNFILHIVFDNFIEQDLLIQSSLLSLMEKVIFSQLGLIHPQSNLVCQVCEMRCDNTKILHDVLQDSLINYNTTILNDNLIKNVLDINDCASSWKSLNVYSDLLSRIDSYESTVLLTKHIVYIFSWGSDNFKHEMFLRAILPNLLQLVFEIKNNKKLVKINQIRMECYLSILPYILTSKKIS